MDDLPQKQQASKSSEAAVIAEENKVESLTMRSATDDASPSARDTEREQQSQTAKTAKVDADISDENFLAELILTDLKQRLAEEKVAENSLKSKIADISNQLANEYKQTLLQASKENDPDMVLAACGEVNSMLKEQLIDMERSKFKKISASLRKVILNYEKAQEQQKHSESNERSNSFASIAYQITDDSLTHTSDLSDFSNKIRHVYDEFYTDNNEKGYIGPYFPFVQSSGMGKTKLIYEFKKQFDTSDRKVNVFLPGFRTFVRLVLCRNQTTDDSERQKKEREVFDTFLSFELVKKSSFQDAMKNVFRYLDTTFIEELDETSDAPLRLLILMFDEAHYLLQERKFPENEYGNAFLFRAIRLWICTRWEKTHVVAVFTGTNTKIGNFRIESDKFVRKDKEQVATDSRVHAYQNPERQFYNRGTVCFVPFFRTTTIGCLHKRLQKKPTQTIIPEYRLAIPHGRPLFALMDNDKDDTERLSKGLDTIVSRMLINRNNWEHTPSAWISILGTRVQMGQTSIKVASEMVASAYANLVNVDDNVDEMAKVTFMPDPVCARLAMCLMDNDWSMKRLVPRSTGRTAEWTLNGKAATWWSEKAQEVFSGGICTPEKGDVGEIMVALYFLFCGDVLRKRRGDEYHTFSVPLDSWIYQLKGADEKAKGAVQATTSVPVPSVTTPSSKKRGLESISQEDVQGTISFSAIQVCRNYLRAYADSWASLVSQTFLRHLYEAGVGFYAYPSCKTIDMVFALKMTEGPKNDIISYLPMVVSVKARATFTSDAARKECDEMIYKARMIDKMGDVPILCLLVVLGGNEENDGEWTLSKECVNKLLQGHPVAQVLRVPKNDRFGITKAFLGSTSARQEESEILSSHYFLGAHAADDESKIPRSSSTAFVKSVLRSSTKESVVKSTDTLLHALRDRK